MKMKGLLSRFTDILARLAVTLALAVASASMLGFSQAAAPLFTLVPLAGAPFPTNPVAPPGLNLGVIVGYAFYAGWLILGVAAILVMYEIVIQGHMEPRVKTAIVDLVLAAAILLGFWAFIGAIGG